MFDFDMRAGGVPSQPEENVPIVGPGQLSRYRGLRFEEMNAQQLRTAYRSIAAALIDYRAQAFAPHLAGMTVMRRQSQEEAEQVEPDHPWVELLRKPSPHVPATIFFEVCSKIVDGRGHVDLMVAYRSEAGRDVPDALRIVYPEYADVDPIFDEMGDVRAWEITRHGGGTEILHPKSVIRLKRPHPSAAWRTAGKMLSSEQSATGEGRDGARAQFDEYTVQPYVNKRAEQLSHELRRVFEAEDSGLFLKAPDVVQMSPEQKLDIDRKRLETGTPPNRVLRERGEEEVEGGDTPMVARGLQSLQKATGPSLG